MEIERVRITPDGRLTAKEAARFLGHEPKTLANWRCQGKGPQPRKVGGRVFYRLEDLQAFVNGETEAA
ncbi:helix-turn-helix domain-containing protein [Limibacillus sp. MBR-115]|jgi:predicted site-specific integrase-resolvase|uniref:helix-turn-helix transcriptional regulator n=1 Tax=Limibacillus sp. MBR-115 TaxID=3156465 RepID=UPI003397E2AA